MDYREKQLKYLINLKSEIIEDAKNDLKRYRKELDKLEHKREKALRKGKRL